MPKIKRDPDAVVRTRPGKKDKVRWCKGKVGVEHSYVETKRHDDWFRSGQNWIILHCSNCGRKDYKTEGPPYQKFRPCSECGERHNPREHKPYPREMNPPASSRFGTRFREGTSYRRKRAD